MSAKPVDIARCPEHGLHGERTVTMQMTLPLKGRTICGYCLTALEAVVTNTVLHYECPRCAPLLRAIRTEAEFKRFCIAAAKVKP